MQSIGKVIKRHWNKCLFHCHYLLYKFHKNSTLTGRLLTAWTTEQLARNTRSSFSVLKRRAYLQGYVCMGDTWGLNVQLLYDLIWFVTALKFRTFTIFGTAYISHGAVDWGVELQGRRSRVRFPIGSLGFFTDLILPATFGPDVDSTSNRHEYQGYLPRGKGGRCLRMTTLPPSRADCTKILGTSTLWRAKGLSRPVMG